MRILRLRRRLDALDLELDTVRGEGYVMKDPTTRFCHERIMPVIRVIVSRTIVLGLREEPVEEGGKLYIYPEQYEGQECHPLIFCTGPVPAQQVDPLISWLMRETGARTFYLPSADYIWPRVLNARVHDIVTANGGFSITVRGITSRPERSLRSLQRA